jgi:hypothetical protein
MQRITLAGRLIITLLVVGLVFFGFRYFAGSKQAPPSTGPVTATIAPSEAAQPTASSPGVQPVAFAYEAPAPVGGKLKGVVELGASGFNSFVVRIDQNRNWKLEQAEFGNSLVLENMATDNDVRLGLKSYIGKMLDTGVSGRDIHFVVSSGALMAPTTVKIMKSLKSLGYVVNTVTAEKEGVLGLRSVLPPSFAGKAFVADIGSGNTKISWLNGNSPQSLESYGAKYFEKNTADAVVAADVKAKAEQVPAGLRQTCFIIGGIPSELAKQVRQGKERYTVLKAADAYQLTNAKGKSGLTIYKALAEGTGCQQFVFDWDANFTIGYLLTLPAK